MEHVIESRHSVDYYQSNKSKQYMSKKISEYNKYFLSIKKLYKIILWIINKFNTQYTFFVIY